MNLDKYKAGILKTGFVLENRIAQALKKQGWSVISGKYYEDDFEDKVREIDLIAYRVGKSQHFDVYTCLIVSCKKSESNVWALLCRELNLKDPNLDLQPLHSWSNQPSIQYQLSSQNKAKDYYRDILKLGVKDVLDDPSVEIFAFQEMNSESGAPQNQKNIYDSIISLIKAQAYEMSALPERKKAPCVYQFNLLSVIDADIIRLKFKDDEISAEQTHSEHLVSRYILKRKQSFSKIRFINASFFQSALKNYGELHKANLIWYGKECDCFFDGIETDSKRLKVYKAEFKLELSFGLEFEIYDLINSYVTINDISLYWNKNQKRLNIHIIVELNKFPELMSLSLNNYEGIRKITADALKKVYRYSGPFYIDADIPF